MAGGTVLSALCPILNTGSAEILVSLILSSLISVGVVVGAVETFEVDGTVAFTKSGIVANELDGPPFAFNLNAKVFVNRYDTG